MHQCECGECDFAAVERELAFNRMWDWSTVTFIWSALAALFLYHVLENAVYQV